MTDSELEELQLQVEGGICKLPIVEMEQLAEHVGLESKEYKGKSKLAMSRIVQGHQTDCFGEYLFGRPVIASNFRLGKCHLELS